ncbi:MAG TPA: pyruvate:ferredoxin (flavodoxin) oxidoreductase [Candidatus Polarisedimenticolaceae bacterium]
MSQSRWITIDGNEAAASVAYRASEVIAVYPITPSSTMGELSDEWSAKGMPNLWGTVPKVAEMQSEGGAAGAIHGALQAGALATTFTASQGLLLMIPNLYKIAGELTPFVLHVAARAVATHALSIFGDHSDVMACRQTGLAMLAGGSVQEAHDMAAIAHAATLRSRVPFLHFFDGFRTSHEVAKIVELDDATLRAILDEDRVRDHRARALTPDRPVVRGTAQNPDVFFQAREAANPFYLACPAIVRETMEQFAERTGRKYRLFDYVGHPSAERVIVMMGSGAEAAHEAVERLAASGERVGLVKVRLYRPFSIEDFVEALPVTVKGIAVLDRCKEPGSVGEPLYLDVVAALREAIDGRTAAFLETPKVVGGRYGLASKEFDPAMAKAALDNLDTATPRNHFTLGIVDDVTHGSLPVDASFRVEREGRVEAVFYGLGADGTVGANKNSIKIIGEETEHFAQGYFVYDSKKSGATTVSHLRFGPGPIRSTYLVKKASFVACHQFGFLEKLDVLETAAPGATFLLNSPYGPDTVWAHLPLEVQQEIVGRRLKFWVVDAAQVAKDAGMPGRINVVMQACFFALSGVLPREEAIREIKASIQKAYGKRGAEVVQRNFTAVDRSLEHLREVPVPAVVSAKFGRPPAVSEEAPDFVKRVTAVMLQGKGDLLPVSAFPPDGTWPIGTARWEKRAIAAEIPVWDPAVCIQCNKCVLMCPHAAIRAKVYPGDAATDAPATFKGTAFKGNEYPDHRYTIQVAGEDCTGCQLCFTVCPAKDKSNPRHKALEMTPYAPELREAERANYDFFLDLPDPDRETVRTDVKGSQFLLPLFEYSGACAGCGETPYVKLLSQLFGDRLLIANATGCSSIYGGNLPTTPYTVGPDGRGPAWSNSLFEDNAEFGFGMRLGVDSHLRQARALVRRLAPQLAGTLVEGLLAETPRNETTIREQRARVEALKAALGKVEGGEAAHLLSLADYLVPKSVWLVGGDGWAYDIGFGGLDHVLAQQLDVNVLVLDTEVYSNTGGQASKATPLGASAKFAVLGKETAAKDLGMLAMSYGNVYVARVAIGARDVQTVKAFQEAESWHGPSLILAYSSCIAHGYDMAASPQQQKLAVDSGFWPLYRYDPRRVAGGEPPLQLDSPAPKIPLKEFMRNETRFRVVEKTDPERFKRALVDAQRSVSQRFAVYQQLAGVTIPNVPSEE